MCLAARACDDLGDSNAVFRIGTSDVFLTPNERNVRHSSILKMLGLDSSTPIEHDNTRTQNPDIRHAPTDQEGADWTVCPILAHEYRDLLVSPFLPSPMVH